MEIDERSDGLNEDFEVVMRGVMMGAMRGAESIAAGVKQWRANIAAAKARAEAEDASRLIDRADSNQRLLDPSERVMLSTRIHPGEIGGSRRLEIDRDQTLGIDGHRDLERRSNIERADGMDEVEFLAMRRWAQDHRRDDLVAGRAAVDAHQWQDAGDIAATVIEGWKSAPNVLRDEYRARARSEFEQAAAFKHDAEQIHGMDSSQQAKSPTQASADDLWDSATRRERMAAQLNDAGAEPDVIESRVLSDKAQGTNPQQSVSNDGRQPKARKTSTRAPGRSKDVSRGR